MSRKADHITPLLIELHWLPVEQRIIFKILLFMYKIVNGLAPMYLSQLLVPYVPRFQDTSFQISILLISYVIYILIFGC